MSDLQYSIAGRVASRAATSVAARVASFLGIWEPTTRSAPCPVAATKTRVPSSWSTAATEQAAAFSSSRTVLTTSCS